MAARVLQISRFVEEASNEGLAGVGFCGRLAGGDSNRSELEHAIQIRSGRLELWVGLYEAIQRFDPRRGYRVSTHAAPWIRNAILQAYNKTARLVRVPSYLLTAHRRASRWRQRFELVHGRAPSVEELAAATQLRPGVIERLSCFRPVASVSLDASVNEAGELAERLEDEAPGPERWLEAVELEAELRGALETLPEIEAEILRRRFGLSGAKPESLRALGEVYSLSHERVRQLQERGIRRLREALGRRPARQSRDGEG